MRSLFARSLMAALTLGTLVVSQTANAQTDSAASAKVLLGNEGLGIGSLSLGGSTTGSGYTHPGLAQGFKVGATDYIVTTVDVGLVMMTDVIDSINAGNFALDVALYSSVADVNGKQVPGDRILTFNPVPTNTTDNAFVAEEKVLYTFGYLNTDSSNAVTLEANTSYWVIVSYTPQDSSAPVFYWQFATPSGTNLPQTESPIEKNASGVTYLGTLGQHAFSGDWVDHGPTSTDFSNSGLRFAVSGYEVPVIDTGGGGGVDQTPPTLDCYAYSKGYFKNRYPTGWPASVIANGGIVIGTQVYTTAQLRTMLAANTTRGNQIGQLASQLVAVTLSLELAKQAAGPNYLWWNGWAPDSADAQAAYTQAASLINASAGFDSRGRLTGCVTGVGALITALDGYIVDNHCDDSCSGGGGYGGGGHGGGGYGGGGHDDDDDDHHCGGSKKDRDRGRCGKKVTYQRRDPRKSHNCR
jgi:hypothetical protein